MALSVREEVVQAVEARLKAITTKTSRCLPHNDQYPHIAIWDVDEDVDAAHGVQNAQIPLVVEYVAEYDADPSTTANAMLADLVKNMTGSDPTFGGLADGCSYSGAVTEYPDSGESLVGVRAVFLLRYQFLTGDPFTRP